MSRSTPDPFFSKKIDDHERAIKKSVYSLWSMFVGPLWMGIIPDGLDIVSLYYSESPKHDICHSQFTGNIFGSIFLYQHAKYSNLPNKCKRIKLNVYFFNWNVNFSIWQNFSPRTLSATNIRYDRHHIFHIRNDIFYLLIFFTC